VDQALYTVSMINRHEFFALWGVNPLALSIANLVPLHSLFDVASYTNFHVISPLRVFDLESINVAI
jgi:hypothetical protein